MGITFRDGSYVKHVTFGKRTIKAGEAAAVWDMYGNHTLCIGPMLKRLFFSDIRFLDQYTANTDEYLLVEFTDGKKEHIIGPVKVWMDPLNHRSITVKNAVFIPGPTEGIVVNSPYGFETGDNKTPVSNTDGKKDSLNPNVMHRRVVRGPVSYFPTINEKIHTFDWSNSHGSFEVLKTMQNWECNVTLPLSDNVEVNLYLTISWTILDPLLLVDHSSDPINDMRSSLLQDMAKYGASISQEDLKNISQVIYDGKLPIQTLKSRSEKMGLSINSIVLRQIEIGRVLADKYKAQEKLASKLSEESAAAEQENELLARNVKAKEARASAERELEASNQAHQLQLAQEKHQATLRRKIETDEANLKYLKELNSLGVDLTKYLCAQVTPSLSPAVQDKKDAKTI